jgi:ribosomal protein L11 methyltransferase
LRNSPEKTRDSSEERTRDFSPSSNRGKETILKWNEICITTTTEGAEAAAELLIGQGASGAAIYDVKDLETVAQDGSLWDYINDPLKLTSRDVLVKAYFPESADIEKITSHISSGMDVLASEQGIDIGSCAVHVSGVDDEDWAENWKKYYRTMHIGRRLVIKPAWETDTDDEGRLAIILNPGAAFGTGTHESTQLCLELMEDHIKGGEVVLDVGTGTGVLAIAACRLGAKNVDALDRDELALQSARENAERNHCPDVRIYPGDLLRGIHDPFDLITANITAGPIIDMLPGLRAALKEGGLILLSGIIASKEAEVINTYEAEGYEVLQRKQRNEWVALCCRKKGRSV